MLTIEKQFEEKLRIYSYYRIINNKEGFKTKVSVLLNTLMEKQQDVVEKNQNNIERKRNGYFWWKKIESSNKR